MPALTDDPSSFPWFPLFASDWLGSEKVGLMSLAAQGAYLRLLCHQWRNGDLPGEPARLRVLSGAAPDEWAAVWPELEEVLPESCEGRRANARLAAERDAQEGKRAKKVAAAAAANAKRWAAADPDPAVDGSQTEGNRIADGGQAESEPTPNKSQSQSQSQKPPSGGAGGKEASPDAVLVLSEILGADWGSPETRAVWTRFEAYRRERKKPLYKTEGLKSLAAQLKAHGYAPAGFVALVERCMASGWDGIPTGALERGKPPALTVIVNPGAGLTEADARSAARG